MESAIEETKEKRKGEICRKRENIERQRQEELTRREKMDDEQKRKTKQGKGEI
jgi:hypothetical protein